MSKKATHFGDTAASEKIMATNDPVLQKGYGRDTNIIDFDRKEWDKIKDKLMKEGVSAKFEQNELLKDELVATGDKYLVEANPFDTYWSCGIHLTDKNIGNTDSYKGKNMLGKLLVEIRNEIIG